MAGRGISTFRVMPEDDHTHQLPASACAMLYSTLPACNIHSSSSTIIIGGGGGGGGACQWASGLLAAEDIIMALALDGAPSLLVLQFCAQEEELVGLFRLDWTPASVVS